MTKVVRNNSDPLVRDENKNTSTLISWTLVLLGKYLEYLEATIGVPNVEDHLFRLTFYFLKMQLQIVSFHSVCIAFD